LTLDRNHQGHCYYAGFCSSGGTTTYGFTDLADGSSNRCAVPIFAIQADGDCETGDGQGVIVSWHGAAGPLQRGFGCGGGGGFPPPSPVTVGPCGPGGAWIGVFIDGDLFDCVDPNPVSQVGPCHQLTPDLWAGVSVNGTCIAAGTCQSDGQTGVATYRNGSANSACVHA
jgi:hypothetical protein